MRVTAGTVSSAVSATVRTSNLSHPPGSPPARPISTNSAGKDSQVTTLPAAATPPTGGCPIAAVRAASSGTASTSAESTESAQHEERRLTWHRDHYHIWRGNGSGPVDLDELVQEALVCDIVLLGEEHDDRVAHALQYDICCRLHAGLAAMDRGEAAAKPRLLLQQYHCLFV